MEYGVSFSLVNDENFSIGQLISIKPGGALWKDAEIAGLGFAIMTLTQEEYDDASANMIDRGVNNTTTPTAIVAI